MEGRTETTVTVFSLRLSPDEARAMYAALYRMTDFLNISFSARAHFSELQPLFDLYDLLNENGFSE